MSLEVGRAVQFERSSEGGEVVLAEHRPRPDTGPFDLVVTSPPLSERVQLPPLSPDAARLARARSRAVQEERDRQPPQVQRQGAESSDPGDLPRRVRENFRVVAGPVAEPPLRLLRDRGFHDRRQARRQRIAALGSRCEGRISGGGTHPPKDRTHPEGVQSHDRKDQDGERPDP